MAARLGNERGIALPVALFALVIIGALVAGAFFAGRLERTMGSNTVFAAQAGEAAEAGLADMVANWDPNYNAIATGGSATVASTTVGSNTRYSGTVSRLNSTLYFVRSRGERTGGGQVLASRDVGMLARLVTANIQARGAVNVVGTLRLGGSAEVDGRDEIPPGWAGAGCPAPGNGVNGITTPPGATGNVTFQPANKVNDVYVNSPNSKVGSDSAVTAANFNATFNQLATVANIRISSPSAINPNAIAPDTSASGGTRCNTSSNTNWGQPNWGASPARAACRGYFPIIHLQGNSNNWNLQSNAWGQGILLVDGNLDLRGGFQFHGIVMVRGDFSASNGTNNVFGTVFSGDATLDQSTLTGNSVVQYSSCTVTRALQGSARGVPLRERSWAMLYQ